MTTYTNVKVSYEDRVGVLTIDHPPANALNWATLNDLEAAFAELCASESVKVIIRRWAGIGDGLPHPHPVRSGARWPA